MNRYVVWRWNAHLTASMVDQTEPIFILIVVLSIAPMLIEWYRRHRAAKKVAADAVAATPTTVDDPGPGSV